MSFGLMFIYWHWVLAPTSNVHCNRSFIIKVKLATVILNFHLLSSCVIIIKRKWWCVCVRVCGSALMKGRRRIGRLLITFSQQKCSVVLVWMSLCLSICLSVLLWSAVRLLYLSCWISANFSGVFVCTQHAKLIHKQNADHKLLQP